MYDWLIEALEQTGAIVTANRRLARLLKADYAIQQQQAGRKAWVSPEIDAWQDWLQKAAADAQGQDSLPTRINANQSQWLWEKCWRQELGEQNVNFISLVRQSRDAWQRLADWQLGIADITRAAQNDNQRTFAAVAARYTGLLKREQMVDDAGMAELLLSLIDANRIQLAKRYTFAGFDRQRPVATGIQNAIKSAGATIHHATVAALPGSPTLEVFETSDAELRAAGAWARRRIQADPAARVAIIANNLEAESDGIARCVRDGATPGWQHGPRSLFEAVNVSFGRRLSDYPAIRVGLTLLRWLMSSIPSRDVSLLLRSPLLGKRDVAGRCRFELALRQSPDRAWTPSMLTSEFRGREEDRDTVDWLARLTSLSMRRRDLPKNASPADWAIFFNTTLAEFGWPGETPLDSDEFQLINRWRELLNEFARLALVNSSMNAEFAIARLELMASETVFQPESTKPLLQLMGPLEASGAEFDALWITGLSSANWPPSGAPSVLISRRLQQEKGMPDSTPDDTVSYADAVLSRLLGSATAVVCSYASSDDDVEHTASDLLTARISGDALSGDDPGWYATRLTALARARVVDDPVPAVSPGEVISGGAAAIQNQVGDPVTAFVANRMHAKRILPQAVGIPASMRGNLVHDALYKLYVELPSSEIVRNWRMDDLNTRIGKALDYAFIRHEKNTDLVLHQLLVLERGRLDRLLRTLVEADRSRDPFAIASVEAEYEFEAGNIRLTFRFDRLDRFDDGTYAILDYKTGSKKRLLNRENDVHEYQLFVYACATDVTISALALVNIDSREISFDGAGRGFTSMDDWPGLLQAVKDKIAAACTALSAGDVQINVQQGLQSARPLNVLTRFTELKRDLR